jgi:hypothetical protein
MQKIQFLILFLLSVTIVFGQKKKPKKNKKEAFHYLSNCKTTAEIEKLNSKLEIVYYLHMGEFSNQEQMDTNTNPQVKPQEVIRVPIWQKERVGEYWGITCLVSPNTPQKPVGQMIFKMSKLNRDTILFESFGLPEEMKGNFWYSEKGFANFKPNNLVKLSCKHIIIGEKMDYAMFLAAGEAPCPTRELHESVHGIELGGTINLWGSRSTTVYYGANGSRIRDNKNNPVLLKRGDVRNPKYKDVLNPKK